eukprot:CAMPEP_0119344434 /NCGR_PEP_ID=MMETSP1333-20130426/106970_1 /TAXON_ID=418940 /ORGANISM="Scyphosphaera apsteinii, Strain RCC1455" /LENGTH=42 /DNA_ID= /DNA_START= /DNA_END= /DNA_ORIENTATION=
MDVLASNVSVGEQNLFKVLLAGAVRHCQQAREGGRQISGGHW